jgi:hypothetical protein
MSIIGDASEAIDGELLAIRQNSLEATPIELVISYREKDCLILPEL